MFHYLRFFSYILCPARLHASFDIILEEESRAKDRAMHFASNMPGMWDIFSSALRIMGVSETVDGYQIPDRVHDLKTRTQKKKRKNKNA